jgi:hypothetical protein
MGGWWHRCRRATLGLFFGHVFSMSCGYFQKNFEVPKNEKRNELFRYLFAAPLVN